MFDIDVIFGIAILIMSVVVHEVSHGYAALLLGDPTAKYEGRLTLNPLKHLDPVGSFVVPLLTSLAGMTFGWARPVPYNPYNLKDAKWGPMLVALAGPLSNILIAVVFVAIFSFGTSAGIFSESFKLMVASIVTINIFLAFFNLVPLPPLDGSKVIAALLPPKYQYIYSFLEQYQIFLMVIFVFVLWKYIAIIPMLITQFLLF